MLVHHADPKSMRITRRRYGALLVIDNDLPVVRMMIPHDTFHERALTCPVFTKERAERPRFQGERDVVEGEQ
jgi:hypothetical protein